jgi:hypothetical protein
LADQASGGSQSRLHDGLMLLALAVLIASVYAPALWFPLSDHDDLTLLLTAEGQPNSWYAFVGDWGMGNNRWRPLHALGVWLGARMLGARSLIAWAAPRQALNLLLHGANGALLYLLLRRLGRTPWLAGLLTALGLVSLYTVSPTVWISDRPTLWVALCTLLLLERSAAAEGQPPTGWALALSIVALLAKESGLVVPALVVVLAFRRKHGWPRAAWALALIGCYGVLRRALFPAAADSLAPHESGFLLGLWPYDTLPAGGAWLPALAAIENVAKAAVGVVLPVFNRNGGLYQPQELLLLAPTWAATAWLSWRALAAWRTGEGADSPSGMLRLAAFAGILLNAAVHYALFRHRNMYLGQMMWVLALGASACWTGDRSDQSTVRSPQLALAAVGVLLVSSTIWVGREVAFQQQRRVERLGAIPRGHPLLDEVHTRYDQPSRLVVPGLMGLWPGVDAAEADVP